MHHLKSIENKFEFLSFRLKSEFFLFPLIILLSISFILNTKEKTSVTTNSKILNLSELKMKDKLAEILNKIEEFSIKNKIILENITKTDKNIELTLYGNFEKILSFLAFIESLNNFSKINSFELNNNSLSVQIGFDKFYKKDLKSKKVEQIKIENKTLLKLFAIIDDTVLINDFWLKKNEKIASYKIIEIKNNMVILENDFEKIELKLYKDE